MKRNSHCCGRLDLDGTVRGLGQHIHVPVARSVQPSPPKLGMGHHICAEAYKDSRNSDSTDFHMSFVRRQMSRSPLTSLWAVGRLGSV